MNPPSNPYQYLSERLEQVIGKPAEVAPETKFDLEQTAEDKELLRAMHIEVRD